MSFRLLNQIPRVAVCYNNIINQKCQKLDTRKISYLAIKTNLKKSCMKNNKRHIDMVYREKTTFFKDNFSKKARSLSKTSGIETPLSRRSPYRKPNSRSKSSNGQDECLSPVERFLKKYKKQILEIKDLPKEEQAKRNSELMRKEYQCDERAEQEELTFNDQENCKPCFEDVPMNEGEPLVAPKKRYDDSLKKYECPKDKYCDKPPPRLDDLEKPEPLKKLKNLDDFSNHSFKGKGVRPGMYCEKIRILKQKCCDKEYTVVPPAGRYDTKLLDLKVQPVKEGFCCYEPCAGKKLQRERNNVDFYDEPYINRQRRSDRKKCTNLFGLQCIDPCLPKLIKKYDDSMLLYEHQDKTDLRLRRLRPRYPLYDDTDTICKEGLSLCNIDPPRMDDITCWEELSRRLPKLPANCKRHYSTYTKKCNKTVMQNNYNDQIYLNKSIYIRSNVNMVERELDEEVIKGGSDTYSTEAILKNIRGVHLLNFKQNIVENHKKFERSYGTKPSRNRPKSNQNSQRNEQNQNEKTSHVNLNYDFTRKINELQPCNAVGYFTFSDVSVYPKLYTVDEPLERKFHNYYFDKENENAVKLAKRTSTNQSSITEETNLNLNRKESEHEIQREETINSSETNESTPEAKYTKQSNSIHQFNNNINRTSRRKFSTTSTKQDECGKLKRMFYVNPITRTLNIKNTIDDPKQEQEKNQKKSRSEHDQRYEVYKNETLIYTKEADVSEIKDKVYKYEPDAYEPNNLKFEQKNYEMKRLKKSKSKDNIKEIKVKNHDDTKTNFKKTSEEKPRINKKKTQLNSIKKNSIRSTAKICSDAKKLSSSSKPTRSEPQMNLPEKKQEPNKNPLSTKPKETVKKTDDKEVDKNLLKSTQNEQNIYKKHLEQQQKQSMKDPIKDDQENYEILKSQFDKCRYRNTKMQKRLATNLNTKRFDIIHNKMTEEEPEFDYESRPAFEAFEKYEKEERKKEDRKKEEIEKYPNETFNNADILKTFKQKKEVTLEIQPAKKFPFNPDDDPFEINNAPNLLKPNTIDESAEPIIKTVSARPPRREFKQKNYIRTSKIPQLKKSANIYVNKKNYKSHVIAPETKYDDDFVTHLEPENNDSFCPILEVNKFGKYSHIKSPQKGTKQKNKYAKKPLLKKMKRVQKQTRKYSTQKITEHDNIPDTLKNKINDIEQELTKATEIQRKIINKIGFEKANEDYEDVKSKIIASLNLDNDQKNLLLKDYTNQLNETLKKLKELKNSTKPSTAYENLTPDGQILKWNEIGENKTIIRKHNIDLKKSIVNNVEPQKIQTRNLGNNLPKCNCTLQPKKPNTNNAKTIEDCCENEPECTVNNIESEIKNLSCKCHCTILPKKSNTDDIKIIEECEDETECIETKKKKRPSLVTRLVKYFKARPNCPTPSELKRRRLLQKAKQAAEAAGLEVCLKKRKKIYNDDPCGENGKRYHSTYAGKTKSTESPHISPQNCFLYTQRNVYVGKMYEVKLSKIGVKNALIPRKLEEEPYTYCQICKFVPRNIVKSSNDKPHRNDINNDEGAKRKLI